VRSKRALAALSAALITSALALAGCGGGDDSDPQAAGDEPGSTGKAAELDTWPLTGESLPEGKSAAKKHPVLVLKMDNTPSSAPQVGLGSADLVVEELVEGGVTRLAAFYYSDLPEEAGPVRSMRASDIGIVSPIDGDMVTSGAASVTISRINDAGIDFHSEGSPGLFRNSSRYAPYNLFADLSEVAADTKQKSARPDDYLPWGTAADLPEGAPVSTLAASFGGHTTSWVFRKGHYVNENTYAADGDEFPADSVLVLSVPVGDAGYNDMAGNSVPETQFEGSGPALLFHDGRLVKGTWHKSALDANVTLKTDTGDKLKVPAGKVWIELLPQTSGGLTFSP
jgi:hypothetical protein